MVRMSYQNLDEIYNDIKNSASGRQACTIMIMVANKVDAMAAARILTQMLRTDHIAYVMRPVANIKNVQQVYEKSVTSDIKSIVLINCGAIYNIPKLFGMEQGGDQRIFIMDNHRPFHLANIYSRYNVVVFDDILSLENDDLDIPSDGTDLSGNNLTSSDDDMSEDDDAVDEDELEEEEELKSFVEEGEGEGEAEMDEDEDKADNIENANHDDDKASDDEADDDEAESAASENDPENEEVADGDAGDEADNESNDDEDGEEQEEADEGNPQAASADSPIPGNKRAATDDSQIEAEEDDDQSEEKIKGKRRKVLEQSHNPEKIRRRKLHEYYTKNATYTTPTALMMLHVSYGRHGMLLPIDQLWQVILGVTDSYLRNHITEAQYDQYCHYLREELADHINSASDRSKYLVSNGDTEAMVHGSEAGNIKDCVEYRFFLYRHWSLFDAMYHSPYIAAKMFVWQAKGTEKLQELLAKIGMPLNQSKQSYNFISPELQSLFRQEIAELGSRPEYNLTNPDVMYRSFYRYNTFKNPINASDVVLAATALLERAHNSSSSNPAIVTPNTPMTSGTSASTTPSTATTTASDDEEMSASRLAAFNEAYDCLGMKSNEILKRGISYAIDLQKIIVRKAAIILEGDELIVRLNRLYYCKIDSPSNNLSTRTPHNNAVASDMHEIDEPFTRPQVLTRLGQFIMDVKRNIPVRHGGWTGASLLPLIMLSFKRMTKTYLVIGISPLQSTIVQHDLQDRLQHKLQILTNFKQLFQIAANECGARFWNDSFDTNVVEVHQDDLIDFLGELNDLMKKASAAV